MAKQRTVIDSLVYEAPVGTIYPGQTTGMTQGETPLVRTSAISVPITSYTANHTAFYTEEVMFMDATAGAIALTLPTAVPQVATYGRRYTVVKIDASANAVTVNTTSAQTINGAATASLATQWSKITVVSNGTNWVQIA